MDVFCDYTDELWSSLPEPTTQYTIAKDTALYHTTLFCAYMIIITAGWTSCSSMEWEVCHLYFCTWTLMTIKCNFFIMSPSPRPIHLGRTVSYVMRRVCHKMEKDQRNSIMTSTWRLQKSMHKATVQVFVKNYCIVYVFLKKYNGANSPWYNIGQGYHWEGLFESYIIGK